MPRPVLACLALQLAAPAASTASHDAQPNDCPLVANSLLVKAQEFDIRITSLSSADRAPGDAESPKTATETRRADEGQGRCRPTLSVGYERLRETSLSLSQCPGFQDLL